MGLLSDIQAALLDDEAPVGPILLKMRFLANRLGSEVLEDWVRYEAEGYPPDALVPEYRVAGVAYTGTYMNGFSVIRDVAIPPSQIEEHAGPHWNKHKIRDSMAVVDDMVATEKSGGHAVVNAGDLRRLLHKKIITSHTCSHLTGVLNSNAYLTVRSAVRHKLLDLTFKLEKEVPAAKDIEIGSKPTGNPVDAARTTQVINNILYGGNLTNVTNSGAAATVSVNVRQRDVTVLADALKSRGVPDSDATELAAIVATEEPESPSEPLGARARAWIAEKAGKVPGTLWGLSYAGALEMVKEAVKESFKP
ncbi:hypothetical protein [Falsiroseomonas sp. E2-1-a20]|uniref:AbiTii domain-containing protein n=1 Tax=Falsiroseomonas sp. E2-1-a20 TaxID=3239300 RepID=UPI003F342E45